MNHLRKETAFAKQYMWDDRPRADDIEGMVAAYPASIDWGAAPVSSGINVHLWKSWHARHCDSCTPTVIDDSCYFRVLHHFLDTGFDPPWGSADVTAT